MLVVKPTNALVFGTSFDFSQIACEMAAGLLAKEMGVGMTDLNYHLSVHPAGFGNACSVLGSWTSVSEAIYKVPFVFAISEEPEYTDSYEWCLTGYVVKGSEMIYKQVWSPGA